MIIYEEIQFSTGKPIPYEVYVTNDKQFIQDNSKEMFELIKMSYSNGNKTIHSIADIMASNIVKCVFNDSGKIIALALYKDLLGGHKRFCSASYKEDEHYKEAVQKIIEDDIRPYDNWYWAEVSGPVEHYFKKHNGNPIPNYLVYRFLRKPKKDIISLNSDGVHYTRFLSATDSEPTEKMIFGFKDENSMNTVLEKINNYEKFKIDVNDAVNDLHEDDIDISNDEKSLDAALIFIQELDEMHDAGFNEMLPSWKKQLLDAITKLLKEQKNVNLKKDIKTLIASNLDHAKFLIKHMPVLEFHQFHVEK